MPALNENVRVVVATSSRATNDIPTTRVIVLLLVVVVVRDDDDPIDLSFLCRPSAGVNRQLV